MTEALLQTLRSTFAHRVRALLTLFGVVIGAGSIVLLASLVRGGEDALLRASQGVTDPEVIKVRQDELPLAMVDRPRRELSRADAEALAGRVGGLAGARVAAESAQESTARHDARAKRVRLVSATADTQATYRLPLARGRFLDADDARARRRVCVVGAEVFRELLAPAHGVGARLVLEGVTWTVVGVLREKPILGSSDGTWMWDRKVLVPDTTFDSALSPSHEVSRIYVRKGEGSSLAEARSSVMALLKERHLGVMNFKLDDAADAAQERLILTVIEALLLATGLLSLFASGINIMNVMLVTVRERTREIGLRRALGATRRAILLQFLAESAILAGVGGVIGVSCGAGVATAVALGLRALVGQWTLALPAWSFAAGLALATTAGVGFGLVPAWRAARTDPIDALRAD